MNTLYKKLEQLEEESELVFEPLVLMLKNGSSILCFASEIDDESYVLRNPLKAIPIPSKDAQFRFTLLPLCPYTDDEFVLLDKDEVLTTTNLSDDYLKLYHEVLEKNKSQEKEERKIPHQLPSGETLH